VERGSPDSIKVRPWVVEKGRGKKNQMTSAGVVKLTCGSSFRTKKRDRSQSKEKGEKRERSSVVEMGHPDTTSETAGVGGGDGLRRRGKEGWQK